ncbi:MAG: hypothetical protein ACX936_21365, partial [Marinobacter sp.]
MGNVTSEDNGLTWIIWSGGKPNASWTGLETPSLFFKFEGQIRPTHPSGRTASRSERSAGLTIKLTATGDLHSFTQSVRNHLIKTGMDTITYLRDPDDAMSMISVIEHHPRFTVET